MDRKVYTSDLDYGSKKISTVLKSSFCQEPLSLQGLEERGILLTFLMDPNNALCDGKPFDYLEMYFRDGYWIVRMEAVVKK